MRLNKYQNVNKVINDLLEDLEKGSIITIKARSGDSIVITKESKVGRRALKHCLETILEAC